MRQLKLAAAGALAVAGIAFAAPAQAAVATTPAGPAALLSDLRVSNGQVEAVHYRRYRHCHRRYVRRCGVYGRCRLVVRTYCHRGW
jgi:hypothetical protein